MTGKEKEIAEEMLGLIQKIKHKTDSIELVDRIPSLELNVIISKIEQLHQRAVILKYLHENIDDISQNNTIESEHEATIEIEETLEEEPIIEAEAEEELLPDAIDEETKAESEISPETIQEDLKSLDVPEDTNAVVDESLGYAVPQQRLNDIKTAIGLNDRFLFIKELFSDNSTTFDATVAYINNAPTLEAVQDHIAQFNWDEDTKVTKQFIALINRRFL